MTSSEYKGATNDSFVEERQRDAPPHLLYGLRVPNKCGYNRLKSSYDRARRLWCEDWKATRYGFYESEHVLKISRLIFFDGRLYVVILTLHSLRARIFNAALEVNFRKPSASFFQLSS